MNKREQEIFLRGVAIGMKAVEEFEIGLTQSQENIKERVNNKVGRKKASKLKKWTEADDDVIFNTMNMSCTQVQKNYLKDRTALSIQARRTALGLKKQKKVETVSNIAKLNQ